MARAFDIYKRRDSASVAVKRGFCWPGFFFTWSWAMARGLWLQGILFAIGSIVAGLAILFVFQGNPVIAALISLAFQFTFGLNGNSWRARALESSSYSFAGSVLAASPSQALAVVARGGDTGAGRKSTVPGLLALPLSLQRVVAVAMLTWKAAFRFRLFLVIAGLLLAAVVGLPILIEDDGTAQGFTQILLTYTLSVIAALLGLSTLWLACGTLARDIEECQMQVVATKPIARWQIWLGKWLGIMTLNAALLAISGTSVYALLQWKATKLSPKEQATLRNEVLVARGSVKEESLDKEIEEETQRTLKETLARTKVDPGDLPELRKQINERIKSQFQIVPPGTYRPWQIKLGMAHHFLRDQPLFLRVKFNTPNNSPSGTFGAVWRIGVPNKTQLWGNEVPMSLSPDTFHEFEIPPNLFDENGVLTIRFVNPNQMALLFPLDEGMEVLYRESGFGINFIRGLAVILCWMGLLAALGLAAASYFSFPVAAFVSLSVLVMSFSSGTLASAVAEGKISNYNGEHGPSPPTILDYIVIPVFRSALAVINLAKDFSPVDSLSTGRSITWWQLGQAFAQIILLLGGIIAVIGIVGFNRRELATAQATQ